MKNFVSRFANDESGATAIEYGLIAAIVSVGIITALGLMSDQLEATFNSITTALKP
jgi:pilus assembly protein Flp/PilA